MSKTFADLCEDHKKVIKTIKSCKTLQQLLVSRQMIKNFRKVSDYQEMFLTSLESEYQAQMEKL